ncbi:MAG: AMP-binding protein [Polyangiaceae bacterium]|nr:AMP-binding protein [Polyangiaceae bacterium]
MFRLTLGALTEHGASPALISHKASLSYTELAERAAVVTRTLRKGSVLPGSAVALLSSGRGFDEAISLCGILAAGNIAVPLDAHAPPARLAEMVRSRGCRALIHDEGAQNIGASIESSIEEGASLLRIVLDEQGTLSSPTVPSSPTREITLRDLSTACILHTSGSTGVPKPVPISWAGLDAFTEFLVSEINLTSQDRVLRVAELVFDLAWFDHIATFRVGAGLMCLGRKDLASGRGTRDAILALNPSVIYGVPSLFIKLTAALPPGETLPNVRVVLFAGEVFPPKELAAFAARVPNAVLYNLYGPTETNVCTYHRVSREELNGVGEIPIGKACPYASCSIVADDGSLVENAGAGELYVSGPTTVGGGPYPTRDRVERGADGLYRFRGRIDRMVKIRGYRVEPGEVESALCTHANVEQAAVIAIEDPRLGKVLHAYVAAKKNGNEPIAERALRMFLAEKLPPYMVPEKVFILDDLPRTVTGKIDYQALGQRAV